MLIHDTSISAGLAGNGRVQYNPQSMRYGAPNTMVIPEANATGIKDTSRTLVSVCGKLEELMMKVTQTVKCMVSHLRVSVAKQGVESDSTVSVTNE